MDWASFDARARAAEIPRLAALRADGFAGWLAGAPRRFGPSAASSIVTGVQPEAHGIWRDDEAWPGGLRPIGKTSWRVQPLWARLQAAGISTGSVGWPATRPGADWLGLHIDDSFLHPSGRGSDTWALPLHCVRADRRDAIRDRRVHTTQITAAMLAPLLPKAAFEGGAYDDKAQAIRVRMAQAATVQSAGVWMLAESGETPPDAVFVHQAILQHARRTYGDTADDGAVAGAWRLLDGLVGRLADLAGPDCLVLVVSSGWQDAPGVIIAAGPGVTRRDGVENAGLLDIAPTILAVFGMADPHLPGKRLSAVAALPGSRPAPSPRRPGRLMPDPRLMGALRLFGYRPPRRPPPKWGADGLGELALMMLDRDPIGALRAADAALAIDPDAVTTLRVKVRAHVALQQPEPLEALGDTLRRLAPDRGWGALSLGARHILRGEVRDARPWLKQSEADTSVTTLVTVGTLWIAAGRLADAARVFQKVVALDPGNVTAEIGLAMAASARRDFMAAEAGLHRARLREPGRPAIWLQLAQVYARSGRKLEAARVAATALRLGAAPALAAAAEKGRLPV